MRSPGECASAHIKACSDFYNSLARNDIIAAENALRRAKEACAEYGEYGTNRAMEIANETMEFDFNAFIV